MYLIYGGTCTLKNKFYVGFLFRADQSAIPALHRGFICPWMLVSRIPKESPGFFPWISRIDSQVGWQVCY